MKRNIIIFAAVAIAVGGLSLVAVLSFGGDHQDIYDELSEMMVARPLLMVEYSQLSCECLKKQDGEDSELFEECVAETREMESKIDDLDGCIIDSLRSMDSPPPAGIESVMECSKTKIGEVRDCMEAASEEYEKCSLDFFEATQECQKKLMSFDCAAAYDEESGEWMERGSEAFEECMGDEPAVADIVDEIASVQGVVISIDQEAIEVDGQVVETLSEGHLDDRDGRMEPLASLQKELDSSGDDTEAETYEVYAHGLVPYHTIIEVMLTFTKRDLIVDNFRFEHIDESSYKADYGHLRPDDRYDDLMQEAVDAEDRESLELTVTVSGEGFYVSANRSVLDAIDGCHLSGATVCLGDDEVDPPALFEEARRAHREGDQEGAAQYYDQALDAYDFRGLYNVLRTLSHDHADESTLRLAADTDLPMGLIYEVMNTAKVELAEDHYDDHDSYRRARLDGPAKGWLFPDAFFAVFQ